MQWRKKKWSGPIQYEDPSGELMMLPTDMVRTHCTLLQWPATPIFCNSL
jgi:hypothetical protein